MHGITAVSLFLPQTFASIRRYLLLTFRQTQPTETGLALASIGDKYYTPEWEKFMSSARAAN